MLSATMRSTLTQALRQCARGQPPRALPSRVALVRHSFLVAPSYKARVAVRGFATATASKTTGRTAAKPATKKKATTKTKAAPKAKAKATATKAKKATKAPAKKKAVAKPKKPVARKNAMSPEKKELLVKRELKKVALMFKEPKQLPASPWLLYVSNALKGQPSAGLSDTHQKLRALSADFKALSPAEMERLDETVAQNKAINAGNFKTWVESHSPVEIEQANKARRRLKREFNTKASPLKLHDDRLPKRPSNNAYCYFIKARHSGAGLSRELASQWKTLSAAEKKPYQDLAVAEFTKYKQEMDKIRSA
ncbi:hypothetical protein KVR01_005649 [Diaporthe batatas]|uniref:uncharacterized protein n=1 Tax=Diaporthe batatas TaxID=748121 RepID=UPI001D03C282|nr:uncharacterized protein KVR01_005649 [Diaporthe batatas]KAG8165374.1 hypothetical protein KVR01_005649 [Diaporthe batatas]